MEVARNTNERYFQEDNEELMSQHEEEKGLDEKVPIGEYYPKIPLETKALLLETDLSVILFLFSSPSILKNLILKFIYTC